MNPIVQAPNHPLRHDQTGNQAAILDALPVSIASLDHLGVIRSTNESWRHFADATAPHAPGHAVGVNYLDICDGTRGGGSPDGVRIANGIRSVLTGASNCFSTEYLCHSSTRQRCFQLTVTPFVDESANGVVVMHVDISARKVAEIARAAVSRDSASREHILGTMLESNSDLAYIFDPEGRILFANRALLALWGIALDQAVGKSFHDLGYPSEMAERLERQIRQVFETGKSIAGETSYTSPTDTSGYFEYTFSPILAQDGAVEFVVGTARDVSERRNFEAKIKRLNRVHAIRGQINALIVRVGNRYELFREACRIAVEQGGFRMSLIAIQDQISGNVVPVASAGKDEGLMAEITRVQSSKVLAAKTMITRSFSEKLAVVSNNTKTDARLVLPSFYADSDINSLAVLPLVVAGEAVGVLVLYASVTDFFHEDEMGLLTELADDIAFAIDNIGKAARLNHVNRVYAMLSGINALVVRAKSKNELYDGACRIAVNTGGFRLALLGVLDQGEMNFVAMAANTDQGEIAAKAVVAASQENTTEMVAEALREKKPCFSNDSQNDPKVAFREAHVAYGVRSMAVIPLIVSGEATGILALYASESEFFQEEEIKLLTGLTGDVAFAIDHIETQQRLEYLAFYDSLTGLANRNLFIERADQCVRSAASSGHGVAMALLDLERFKSINDSLGQSAGDDLLQQVAVWLKGSVTDATLLARVGADHFALMLPGAHAPGDAAREIEKMIAGFHDHPFLLGGTVFRIAAKFGVVVYPEDGLDAEQLFKHAEAALKKAKAGGDRYLFYTQTMTESVARKLTLENQLRQALDNEEFVLHYQPKVNLQSGRLTSAEALIRWNDPRTGLVPPGMFIPILEETGLIYEVGRWALHKSLEDYLRWRNAGLFAVRIAVNVSPLQLRHAGFVSEVERAIGIDAQGADGLELEITESMIMADVKQSTNSLRAIQEMGITIAIDDFGTGYSSLGYLSKLPVNTLKIDRSFITEMTETPDGLSLVSTMINLAHSLKLKVVAEGVETEGQANLLRLLKCDEMQGYLFSKPVPGDIFEERFLAISPIKSPTHPR